MKTKMKMVLTFKDRVEALRRSERYRRDFEIYRQYCLDNSVTDGCLLDWLCPTPLTNLSKGAQDLCEKYGLPFPINPTGMATRLPDETHQPIKDTIEWPAVNPLPLEKGKSVFGLEGGRYLNVSIDIERTEGEITQAIKKLYKHYSAQVKGNQRHGNTELDPWDIYDQVEIEGKNVLQIAKEIMGINENPAYNSVIDAARKRVEAAYDKAKAILEAFEE